MKTYIGIKVVQAIPKMNTKTDQQGYDVVHPDSYRHWVPKKVFREIYWPADGMDFGAAIAALKKGLKVRRKGWNGTGMFLMYVPPIINSPVDEGTLLDIALNSEGVKHKTLPVDGYLQMFTAQATVQPGWLASQADMLNDDWELVE